MMTHTRKDQHPTTGRTEIGSGDLGHPSSGQPQGHGHDHAAHQGSRHSPGPDAADRAYRVKDPVCGMMLDPHATQHKAEHAGRPYHFCSAGCRVKFLAKPDRYLDPAVAAAAEPVPEGTIYTCPMHPEIRQVGPGSCPICGMALEPVLVSLEAEPNLELIDMRRRFWVGLVLTIPVFLLEMGGHLLGLDHLVSQRSSNWIQLIFATPVVLWAGWPFFQRGWQSLVTRNLNMFTLIAMGTGAAWIYSVVATLAPGVFPDAFRQHDGSVAVYFEAAAVITVLVLLGQVLELRSRESTSGAIRALLDLAPKTARRIHEDGTEEEVQLDAVQGGGDGGDRLRAPGGVAAGDDDARAVGGEQQRGLAADAGGSTGDEGGLVLEGEGVGHGEARGQLLDRQVCLLPTTIDRSVC